MTGGLLNLVSYGTGSIILFGNPKKSFFKSTYKTLTNFGMQKFRIDIEKNSNNLRLNEDTILDFKVPRYADLLGDSYLVVRLPDIWSPLLQDPSGDLAETGFKWIEEIGSNLIKEVEIYCGGHTLAKYTGEYFSALVQRDYSKVKKNLWNKMTGNVAELNDPANAFSRVNTYPSVYYNGSSDIEPSIRGRDLYIPLDCWFSYSSKLAIPLIAMQYNELHIKIRLRPIRDLYRIRDVTDIENNYPYIAPDINTSLNQPYVFLNPPMATPESGDPMFSSSDNTWNCDIHIMSNYYFLSNEERNYFATNEQKYLIREVYPQSYYNVTGSKTVKVDSHGLVSNYMMFFRRSDAFMRNEWSNYTNWPYQNVLPYNVTNEVGISPDPNFFVTVSPSQTANQKNILLDMAVLCDGKFREDLLNESVYNYVEKYIRTDGNAKDGVYLYNFGLNSDPRKYEPTGAMNMDKFDEVQFQFNTLQPPANPDSSAFISNICDEDGNIIGTRKNIWNLNEYNYDLEIFEERYNVLIFSSGTAALLYAR